MKRKVGLCAMGMVFLANSAWAGVLTQLTPVFDIEASASGATFTLTEGEIGINTQYFPPASVDRRGILAYDFGSQTSNFFITGASISFKVNTITSSTGSFPQPRIYAYAANAIPEFSDANNVNTLVGTADPVTNIGITVSIPLDAWQIQSIRNSSSVIGITVLGSANNKQFGFYTKEFSQYGPASHATLALTQTLLGDANFSDVVDATDFDIWFRNVGTFTTLYSKADFNHSGSVDATDFDIWFRHVGMGVPGLQPDVRPEASPVPEAATLLLFAGLLPLIKRRTRRI